MLATLRHRDFALLWIAGFISVAGDFALGIALLLHAYDLTGSAIATGGVFAASLLPRVLLGSVVGVFVDRWDRTRTMVTADLLRAILLLPLLTVDSVDLLWLLYLARVANSTVSLFFAPAENALLPRLVGEERLVTANALNSLNNNLGRLAGPAIGGVLYAWGGLPAVIFADTATYLVSAVLVAAIRTDGRPIGAADAADAASAWTRLWYDWTAGLTLVQRNRTLFAVFAASFLGNIGEGTFSVGFIPLAIDVLQGGSSGAGLLVSAQGVSGLAAGAVIASVAARRSSRVLFGGGSILLGLADLGVANAANLAPPGPAALGVAMGFMFAAGFPVVAMNAAGNGLLQTHAADRYRGRVFGAYMATVSVATLIGLGLGGPAVDAVGVVPVLSVGAAMWMIGGLLALALLPRAAPATGEGQDHDQV